MSFDKVFDSITQAKNLKAAKVAASASAAAAERAERVNYIRGKFESLGVYTYLEEQATAMRSRNFHASLSRVGADDRASATLEFVPIQNQPVRKNEIGRDNQWSLFIQSHGETIDCFSSSPSDSRQQIARDFPVSEFTLGKLEEWFDSFVKKALE